MPNIHILSQTDIQQAITMKEAIGLMRDAFMALSAHTVHVPVRMKMDIPEYQARALFMPVYAPSQGQIGLKMVTVHPDNGARGLPFIHALVLVSDATTGIPLAVMDGEYITALRTGAGSGLATDLLARRDAAIVAIFGAGVQARTQLEAVCAVRPIQKMYVFGRSHDRAEAFAHEAATRHNIDTEVAHTPALLRHADIICTATTSLTPVFEHQHVKAGCHINGIGSYRPDMTEIPPATVRAAKVVVDQRKACLAEAGDVIIPMNADLITRDHIHAEIGEIAAGVRTGRTAPAEVTFFKSVGNATQDLAVASHLVTLAKEHNIGIEVTL